MNICNTFLTKHGIRNRSLPHN